MTLQAFVYSEDGSSRVDASVTAPCRTEADAIALGVSVFERLRSKGVTSLLPAKHAEDVNRPLTYGSAEDPHR